MIDGDLERGHGQMARHIGDQIVRHLGGQLGRRRRPGLVTLAAEADR